MKLVDFSKDQLESYKTCYVPEHKARLHFSALLAARGAFLLIFSQWNVSGNNVCYSQYGCLKPRRGNHSFILSPSYQQN